MATLTIGGRNAGTWRPEPGDPHAAFPAGDLVVTLARWRDAREALLARPGRLGLRLEPADDVLSLAGDLRHFDLVCVHFPDFKEGRGYSQARLLRERLGFDGELRATGDVSRDRLAAMARCGVNAFELREGEDEQAARAAFAEISVRYQPGVGEARGAWKRGAAQR